MRRYLYILAALAVASCGGTATDKTEEVKAPAVPTGVKLHSATETSLTFQWSQVEGATYEWKLSKDGAQVKTGSAGNRNTVVSELEPGTTYKFAVRAKNAAGTSAYSAEIEAKTEGTQGGGENPGGGDDNKVSAETYALFEIPSAEEDGTARAFPGAEGGGMYVTGGRGGSVYHVTSLEDNTNEGTLRYGIEKGSRPLTIVFDVAGTIALQKQLNITKGDLTIAGQSAPGDGICLKNYTFRISASNVIVRFIRCRMGDEKKTEDDAIQVMDHTDDKYTGIIIDHCSVSWSTDECASFYGMKDFTFSWNIVSESLRVSIHSKKEHGYGGIWGGNNATYHHNLLAHHDSRNPRIDHDYVSTQKGPVTISNNVVYNWSGNTCYGGESSKNNGDDYKKYNFIGNYYKPGPVTPSNHRWLIQPTTSCSNCGGTILPGHFYIDGNVLSGASDVTSNNWKAGTSSGVGVYISSGNVDKIKENKPYKCNSMSLHSANDAFNAVLNYAGASFARDAIDARIAKETKDGTATYTGSKGGTKGLIDTQTDVDDGTWVDGWPVYTYDKNAESLRDSDSDGMPNWFEEQFGLNKSKNDASGFNLDINGRYTNLEMYLHYLVKDIVKGGNASGTYTTL